MFLFKQFLLLSACAISIKLVTPKCKNSYVVTCESIHDVRFDDNRFFWRELLIQPSNESYKYTLTRKIFKDLGLVRLKRLSIVRQVEKVHSFLFVRDMSSLSDLTLYGNNLTTIRKNALENISLKSVHLKKNNVRRIRRFGFSSCSFYEVDLSYNNLNGLSTDSFYRCRTVKLVIKQFVHHS